MPSTASINARKHDRRLARLQAEVESLRAQLRRAQRLASLGTMTAMVAHEFNNILTPIVNYARLAQENPSLAQKATARAAEGGARAEAICKAILALAYDNNANGRDDYTNVRLAELVEQTIRATARNHAKDRIEIIVDIPDELTVNTRRVELQQVIFNLLLNARKAVMQKKPPRQIRIFAWEDGENTVQIGVSDNGVGIPRENLDKIFQPFFSTTSSGGDCDTGGCGLGLPLCREIVSSLGGKITANSAPGRGADFTISLPVNRK